MEQQQKLAQILPAAESVNSVLHHHPDTDRTQRASDPPVVELLVAPVSSAAVQPAADAADTAGSVVPEETAAASVGTAAAADMAAAAAAVGLCRNLPAEAARGPARVLYLLIYHRVLVLAEKDRLYADDPSDRS